MPSFMLEECPIESGYVKGKKFKRHVVVCGILLYNVIKYNISLCFALVKLNKKGGENKMATVITVPRDSTLKLRLVTGTDPVTGAPIIKTKTFNKVKAAAIDQDVYDTATTLVGLQKDTIDEIRLNKEWQLTE